MDRHRTTRLTTTEISIVELLCEGLTNREIGARIHVEESTVRWHLKNVFRKLDVRTRTELASRWLSDQDPRRSVPISGPSSRDTPHL